MDNNFNPNWNKRHADINKEGFHIDVRGPNPVVLHGMRVWRVDYVDDRFENVQEAIVFVEQEIWE